MSSLIDEGIGFAIGSIFGEGSKVRKRVQSGFPWQEFMRAEGGVVGQKRGLSQEIEERRHQELPASEVQGTTTIHVLGRSAEFGTPARWAARDDDERALMPGNGPDSAICAALYRTDADPYLVYSLQVMTVSHVQPSQKELDPALWLLDTERATGLRAVGRVVCVRLASQPAYLWHMAGTMPGSAVGRPYESMVEIRSSALWCPLPEGTAKILLIAPPERMREGQEAFGSLVSSWRWMPG